MGTYDPKPYSLNLAQWPKIVTTAVPGPKSNALHGRAAKIIRGLSGQVKLFPVCFESGKGCTLTDVDGKQFIDFSSGIYVTSMAHCHPKVSGQVAHYANTLMNAHNFTSEIKTHGEHVPGVEPATCSVLGHAGERRSRRIIDLQPGATWSAWLEFEAC